ncbi:MAG: hypothetical protein MZU97_12095 [Bacillus subtilis]|nr:hypothetical protein [Bacillus subtilis]
MLSYSWPGNVRELENAVERAVVIAKDKTIGAKDLLLGDGAPRTRRVQRQEPQGRPDDLQAPFHPQALWRTHHWNQTETAKVLDIQRTYLSRLDQGTRHSEPQGVMTHEPQANRRADKAAQRGTAQHPCPKLNDFLRKNRTAS